MPIPYLSLHVDRVQAINAWHNYISQYFETSEYPILDVLSYNLPYWKSLNLSDMRLFDGIMINLIENPDFPIIVRTVCECLDLDNKSNIRNLCIIVRRFSNENIFKFFSGKCLSCELSDLLRFNHKLFDIYIQPFEYPTYNALSLSTYYLADISMEVDSFLIKRIFDYSYNLSNLISIFSDDTSLGSSLWTNHLEQFLMIEVVDFEAVFRHVRSLDLMDSTKILFFMANAEVIINDRNYSPEFALNNDESGELLYEASKKARYAVIMNVFTECYPTVASAYLNLKSIGITEFAQLGSLIDLECVVQDRLVELPFIY